MDDEPHQTRGRERIHNDPDTQFKDDTATNEKEQRKSQKDVTSDTDDESSVPTKGKLKSRIGRKKSTEAQSPQDDTDDSEEDSPPQMKSQMAERKSIRSKISRKSSTPEDAPRKTIKSKIGGGSKTISQDTSPTPTSVKQESEKLVIKELTAEEKALQKRMQLKRELEEKRGKQVKKARKF